MDSLVLTKTTGYRRMKSRVFVCPSLYTYVISVSLFPRDAAAVDSVTTLVDVGDGAGSHGRQTGEDGCAARLDVPRGRSHRETVDSYDHVV